MDTTPYSDSMDSVRREFTAKGHILGEWNPRGKSGGYFARCSSCGGKVTLSEGSKMMVVGPDPYLGLGFCPRDDPELMARISDAWADKLAQVYSLILSWPLPDEEEEQSNASDD